MIIRTPDSLSAYILEQKSAECDLWGQIWSTVVFLCLFVVNKVLLNSATLICLHIIHSCFLTTIAELDMVVVTETIWPSRVKIFIFWSFKEKIC